MQFVGERHAEAAVLELCADAEEQPPARPAHAEACIAESCRRVGDRTNRRLVIARAARTTAAPHGPGTLAVLDVATATQLRVSCARVERHPTDRAVERRGPERLLRGDRVDHATNRVAAVKQCGRPLHDLEALEARRVDRRAMVTGLARQIAGADTVLHDEHAVAVEAADDGPCAAGAERSKRDARLADERVGDGRPEVAGQFETVEAA